MIELYPFLLALLKKITLTTLIFFTYILQIVTDISFTWSFTNYPKPRGATTVIPRSRVLVEVRITTVLWTSVVIRLSWRPERKGWGLSSREHFPSTLFAQISMIEPETDCCSQLDSFITCIGFVTASYIFLKNKMNIFCHSEENTLIVQYKVEKCIFFYCTFWKVFQDPVIFLCSVNLN